MLYLGCAAMGHTSAKRGGGPGNVSWNTAINEFDIMFPARLDRV